MGNLFDAKTLLESTLLKPIWRVSYTMAEGAFIVKRVQWHLKTDLILAAGQCVRLI